MQKKTITNIVAAISFILTGVFVSLHSSSSVSAHSLTVSTSGSVTANVIPSADGGIGTTVVTDNVNIISDCRAGYTMTIAGPTDNNLYLNGDSTNNTSGTYFSPVNGTSALNNSANANKWGYSLTANSGTGVFSALSSTPTTLKTPSQTASPDSDINATIPVYYGTAVNTSMAPGSYTFSNNTSIAYTVVMDATCLTVNIAYDGNNADEGTMGEVGTGVIHTGVKDGDTVSLVASNFSRTGYGFAGWSTDPNAGTKLLDNDNTNNPIVYGPQEDVTLPAGFTELDTDNDGIVKLYAVWLQSQGNLQGWMGCNNLDTATYDQTTGALDLTKNSVTALTDQRDNDTYAVARLADGKCWMIENLRLDNDAAHNSDGLLTQGYGTSATYGNFGGLADPETPDKFGASSVANSMYSTNGNNGTINIGTSNASSRFPRYNNKNTQNRALNPTKNESALYSYGNYYTWHAAIADLTPNNTDNNSTTSTSICPAGWHLPTGGKGYPAGNTSGVNVTGEPSTYRDFYNLGYRIMGLSAYESNPNSGTSFYDTTTKNIAGDTANEAFRRYPNNYTYSGAVWNGGYGNYGFRGDYWTSTAHSYSTYSYIFTLFSSEKVFPGTGGSSSKDYGQTIRCINSDSQTYTLTYDANGGSGAPSSQFITANGLATFTITNTVPTRSGYTFAGWMDEKGNEAQPSSSFTTKNPNTTLYAIWTNNSCNPTATTIGTGNASTDAVCLQDVKPGMKSSLSIADATTGTYNLIDARDGQSYTVAKLADGELWLTKNLNYGSNNDALLTPYDTDLPTGTAFKAPASTTDFETTNSDATYISPKILTDNTYGGYYSYAAAIASTTAYSSNQNITTSICPKGWDLPTGAQYDNLRTVSGNTTYAKMSAAPYSFIYAGYRNGTSFSNQTSTTRLWTSTNYSSSYAYYTTAYSVEAFSSNYKRYGESVRCVASNGTATVHYNANGGTGTMADQTGDINSITISSNSFTAPTDGQFRNWNTAADGTGTTVTAGTPLSSIASNGDTIILYAQWDELYYIAFNANESSVGGTPGSATGTMSNQTIVRNTATAIKTNTFTLTGYIFVGWNTAADGTGTLYGDEQKITNLTTTGNTVTLYAVWMEGALLDTGSNVNQKLKRLAGNSSATYATQDNAVTALVRSNTLPNNFTPSTENTISHNSSPNPIYAWYDSTDTTIYYYSTATTILMNKNSSHFFQRMCALSNLSTISSWDTIKVTNMSSMFASTGYNTATFTLDLSSWDTSKVTDMSNMFDSAGYSATTFGLNVSSWDTSSVTSMSNMFKSSGYNAATFVLNISAWDVSNATDMYYMFSDAGHDATTFTLDLSSWNTSSVTNMTGMFSSAGYNATTWSIGDLSSWDTGRVTSMSSMFSYAGLSATTWSIGDLSSWDTTNVKYMGGMFSCTGYNATTWSIGDLSSWDTSHTTDMSGMFREAGYNATTWSIGDLSSWDTSNVTSMGSMFSSAGYNATTWSIGDLSSWNTSNVTNMSSMFSAAGLSATTWSIGDLSSWSTSNVTDMRSMFQNAGRSATTFDISFVSSWDTSKVTNMSGLFNQAGYSATTWSIGDLSSWDTSSATDMSTMFSEAGRSATIFTLNLSTWDTSKVKDMSYMFNQAGYSATTWSIGDLSFWNTSNVKNMYGMFWNAGYSAATFALNLSCWNTSSVTYMSIMFSYAGYSATTWSITIPKTNDGTTTGPIPNTTSNLYGNSTSVTATPPSGKSFTLAN